MVNWGKLIFGGVDSSDYGIYITGEAVYNAPEREVEFIDIPGRNGSLAMDKGRYNNITVTYPAGTFGKNQEDFREALSAFRNAILSQKGYQRLEDTYHPEEYRMGVYAAGLEVSPASRGKAGQFDLSFVCKPQRFLSIGDYPIPVDSGDILQNPTVFDSSPLLEVEGYGTVSFNGFDIELDDSPLGVVTIIPRHFYGEQGLFYKSYNFDRSLLKTGDGIYVGQASFMCLWDSNSSAPEVYSGYSYTIEGASTMTPSVRILDGFSRFWVEINTPMLGFTALDEDDSEVEKIASISVVASKIGGGSDTVYMTVRIKCGYDYIAYKIETATTSTAVNRENDLTSTPVQANSTLEILGHPTYIDCDVGEAYRIEGGEYKSCNARVTLDSDLPALAPGSNKINFDNTVTDLKIAPRWWRI